MITELAKTHPDAALVARGAVEVAAGNDLDDMAARLASFVVGLPGAVRAVVHVESGGASPRLAADQWRSEPPGLATGPGTPDVGSWCAAALGGGDVAVATIADLGEAGAADWFAPAGVVCLCFAPLSPGNPTGGGVAVFSSSDMTGKVDVFAAAISLAGLVMASAHRESLAMARLERAAAEVARLRVDGGWAAGNRLVGRSPQVRRLKSQIALVGPAATPVVVQGERGTGKTLVARLLHEASSRAHGPFVRFSCNAVTPAKMESALFGGTTGSRAAARGAVARAEGGTLFLAHVDALSPEAQDRLTQLVAESRYRRPGDTRDRKADVRVVAGTNAPLETAVEARRFRSDLQCLLSVAVLPCPALRDRMDDVPDLVMEFLDHVAGVTGTPPPRPKLRHLRAMQRYAWPGNLPELRNAVELAVIRSDGRDLPLQPPADAHGVGETDAEFEGPVILTYDELRSRERDNLLAALRDARWRVSGPMGAAVSLGIKPTTLTAKMKAMGIKRPR